MTPEVSVVIPVLDRAHCIGDAIATVLAQEGVELECIVVDDGSTDGTPAVVRRTAADDPRVRLVEIAHGGPSVARNAGIRAATGSLVAFHDSDNLMAPGRLERQVLHLVDHGSDGVFGRYEVELVDDVALPRWVEDRPERHAGWSWISLLVRREPLQAIGGFDEELRLGEDLDLIVRLREHGCTIDAADAVVVVKRWFGDNLTYEIDDVGTAFGTILRRHMARQRQR